MTHFTPAFRPQSPRLPTLRMMPRRAVRYAVLALLLVLAVLAAQALIAQVAGDRGIAPVASSSDITVSGVSVNVTGKSAQEAREKGWKLAQRKGWEKLGGPKSVSESQLENMVSAIVIEKEQIGPRRYIATLGVVFDRSRAGGLLGAGNGPVTHSAPMLTIPVLKSGGTYTVYEVRNDWQRAWAEYQAGASAIDYVRPAGAGGDSLWLNYGQAGRRSRSWWRGVLDAFGSADVLFPIAHLQRQWPGGPVVGSFTARYGPDNRYLDSFSLTAESEDDVPDMLAKAIARFDTIYTDALNSGILRPDPTLKSDKISIDPVIAELLDAERRAQAIAEAAAAAEAAASESSTVQTTDGEATDAAPQPAVTSYVVQFTTPDSAAVDAGLANVRATPGVRGAATSSIAIGGVSVMRVSYTGTLDGLAGALRARGWNVVQGGTALSISR